MGVEVVVVGGEWCIGFESSSGTDNAPPFIVCPTREATYFYKAGNVAQTQDHDYSVYELTMY